MVKRVQRGKKVENHCLSSFVLEHDKFVKITAFWDVTPCVLI
jgi:hypothetical protein